MERNGADYTEATKEERTIAVEQVLASARRDEFLSTINDIGFGVEYINLLNKMFTSLSSLSVITDADKLIAKTEELVSNKAKKIEAVQSHMREFSFTESDYESLQEITAASFLEEVFEEIRKNKICSGSSLSCYYWLRYYW